MGKRGAFQATEDVWTRMFRMITCLHCSANVKDLMLGKSTKENTKIFMFKVRLKTFR